MIETMGFLKNSVAGSAKFQEWVGAANATEAEEYIYTTDVPDDASRPLSLIELSDNYEDERIGQGGSGSYWPMGSVRLWFDWETDEKDDSVALDEFDGFVGQIMEEIKEFSGRPGYLAISRISLIGGPGFPEIDREEKEDKRLMQVTYEVGWN